MYKTKLNKIINESKSNLVIGLDTDLLNIPKSFLHSKSPITDFNKMVIESTYDYCAGYKINLAFYEAMGNRGYEILKNTLDFIPETKIKICDAKRGDIENTDEYYARAYFDDMNFDAITLSPYMGYDSVSPFLKRKDKFVYLLIRTSNPGADDFQNLELQNSKKLFEVITEKSLEWSKDQIGFVIGANHSDEIKKHSSADIPLLIPGVGAQGNDIQTLLNNIHNQSFLINASRSIIYAGDSKAITTAAQELNTKIKQ